MEGTSSSYLTQCEDDLSALKDTTLTLTYFKNHYSSRAVDIGCERSRVVTSRSDSLSLITFDPIPGGGFERQANKSITLSRGTTKNFYDKLDEIRKKVEELRIS